MGIGGRSANARVRFGAGFAYAFRRGVQALAAATRTLKERPAVFGVPEEDDGERWVDDFTELALRAIGAA